MPRTSYKRQGTSGKLKTNKKRCVKASPTRHPTPPPLPIPPPSRLRSRLYTAARQLDGVIADVSPVSWNNCSHTSKAPTSGSNNDPSASPSRRQSDTDARRKSVELSRIRMVGATTEDPDPPLFRRRPPVPPLPPPSPAPGPAEDSPGAPSPTPPPSPASVSATAPPPLGSLACRNCSSAVRIVCAGWSCARGRGEKHDGGVTTWR